MEIDRLNCFLAAFEHGSLVAASRHIGTVQSNISMHISRLERDLGATLFSRTSGGLVPTSSGDRLYRLGSRLLQEVDFAINYIRSDVRQPRKIIHVSIPARQPGSLLNLAFASGMVAARRTYPHVNFRFIDQVRRSSSQHSNALIEIGESRSNTRDSITDRWTLVSLRGESPLGRAALPVSKIAIATRGLKLTLPRLSAPIIRKARQFAKAAGVSLRMLPLDGDALNARTFSSPQQVYVMPLSCIPGRIHQPQFQISPVEPNAHDLAWSFSIIDTEPADRSAAEFFVADVGTSLKQSLRAAIMFSEGNNPVGRRPFGNRQKERVDLRDLRYFETAYEWGNVSRAAEDLRVSQPALSMRLTALEQKLRKKLFDRTGHGILPTDHGDLMHDLCEPILQNIGEIRSQVKLLARSSTEPVRLGVIPVLNEDSILAESVATTLSKWAQSDPTATVKIIEAYNRRLRRWVQQETLDFAIVDTVARQSGLVVSQLSEECMALISSPTHYPLPPGPIRCADVAKLNLALPSATHGLRAIVDTAFNEVGLTLTPSLEVDSMALIVRLVRESMLATILPVSAIYRHVIEGQLQIREIVKPRIRRELSLIHRSGHKLDQRSLQFFSIFRSTIQHSLAQMDQQLSKQKRRKTKISAR